MKECSQPEVQPKRETAETQKCKKKASKANMLRMMRAARQTKRHKRLQGPRKICRREQRIRILKTLKANLNNLKLKGSLLAIDNKVRVLKNIAKELIKMQGKTLAS